MFAASAVSDFSAVVGACSDCRTIQPCEDFFSAKVNACHASSSADATADAAQTACNDICCGYDFVARRDY